MTPRAFRARARSDGKVRSRRQAKPEVPSIPDNNGVRLNLAKQQVQDLPPVNIDHP